MQAYTLHDLKDAVKMAVADGKATGSHMVTAAHIAELPEPGACSLGHSSWRGHPRIMA